MSTSTWIETRGKQERVYWRTRQPGKTKDYEPFKTREDAERFQKAAVLVGGPEQARQLLRELATRQNDGDSTVAAAAPAPTPAAQAVTEITVDDLAKSYFAQKTGVTSRTLDDDRAAYDNHIGHYFGAVPISAVRGKALPGRPALQDPAGQPLSVASWLGWLGNRQGRTRNLKPSGELLQPKTIRNLHGLAFSIFEHVVNTDDPLLPRNPFAGSKLPEVQRPERPYLQQAQFAELLRHMNPHFRTLLIVLVATGIRFGEAAGLRVRDLFLTPDDGRPYIQIRVAWRRNKKGKKMELGRVKTNAARRMIRIPQFVADLLAVLIDGRGPDEPVFTMVKGGRLHHGNLSRYMKAALAASPSIQTRIGFHALRHTHVAWLLEAKVSMAVIQRRLGHESILTTIDIYGHLTDRAEDSACDALDGIFEVSPPLRTTSPAPGVALVGGGLIVTEAEDAVTTAAQDPSVVPDAPGDQTLIEWDLDDTDDLAA